ncbi:MAG: small, acid-soluble spore protein, alpha/beta type [Firmicutes bacterium]|nr:small, acid-soluble spore protein, alpha/beta type [Bacillota bacterium]
MVYRNTRKNRLNELLKLEIAEELGLLEKIKNGGWGALNAAEAGRIGGKLANRLQNEE